MKKTLVLVGSGVVSIPPKFGGAVELIIYEISKSMPKDKFFAYVLDRKESWNKQREIIDGALYIRYRVPKFSNVFLLRLTEFIFGMRAIKKIRELNSKKKVNVVHTHTVFSSLPLAIFKFLLPENCKLVYTSHNPAWIVPKKDLDILNRIIKRIESFIIRKSDYVTTVTDTMKENIIKETKIPSKKIKRIYNFVDRSKFSGHGKEWKERKGIEGPIILFVSKLIPNKGVKYLIRSASLVKKEIPNVKYVVVGPISFEYENENPWIKLVKELGLEGTVVFTGALPEDELPLAYASADVFCFPTLRESFGIVLIEAMASGLPFITTNIPVVKEVVENNAIFVEPKNHKKIAKELIKLLKDNRKLKFMSKKSLSRSRYFDKKKIMDEYKKFYTAIN